MLARLVAKTPALTLVALFGLVSLFADLTYEGARAVTGPYLAILGASSLAVGITSGLGEFAGYTLRLLTGFLADRTRRYWTFTIVGYAINLGAVPALAWAFSWQWAAALVVLERFGKAVRTPSRDALLAQATEQLGHGKGFGLHELLDQVGAVLGPFLVAFVLARKGQMADAFLLLGIPAMAALLILFVTFALFSGDAPPPSSRVTKAKGKNPLPSWILAFVTLHLVGFVHFQLVAYHCEKQGVLAPAVIPLLFALAMAVDGILALPAGALFDRLGLGSLALAAVFTLPVTALVFSTQPAAVVVGVGLWGAGLAFQETVLKAAVAAASLEHRRASAFGLFHFFSGLAWLLGGSLFGWLYQWGYPAMVAFSVAMQVSALAVLFASKARPSERRTGGSAVNPGPNANQESPQAKDPHPPSSSRR